MNDQAELFDVGPRLSVPKSRPPCTAAPIGTGPRGERCGTCRHLVHTGNTGKYLKCGLMQRYWTHGPGTDIKAGWPACEKWAAVV